MSNQPEPKRVPQWYFGGLAGATATCLTHPLDLLKIQVQSHSGSGNTSLLKLSRSIITTEGVAGLYSGISASVMRQLTYSTTRFAFYEKTKQHLTRRANGNLSFHTSLCLAGLGGCTGALAGNPADLVNIRMQNDVQLPKKLRRNYSNVIHGLYEIVTKEGVSRLWTGVSVNCCRSTLATIGQFSFYDLVKKVLLATHLFTDSVKTHITASFAAGAIATILIMPVDVLKTRCMNARPGEIKGLYTLMLCTARQGPSAFFRGYVPAFMRLGPQTVLTFVFYEQLRLHFDQTDIKIQGSAMSDFNLEKLDENLHTPVSIPVCLFFQVLIYIQKTETWHHLIYRIIKRLRVRQLWRDLFLNTGAPSVQ